MRQQQQRYREGSKQSVSMQSSSRTGDTEQGMAARCNCWLDADGANVGAWRKDGALLAAAVC
jgi:hypothetical protein